jgi:hypothetical protein
VAVGRDVGNDSFVTEIAGKPPSPEKRRGAWRVEIAVRIRELEHRLGVVEADDAPVVPERSTTRSSLRRADVRRAHMKAAHQALDHAREAIVRLNKWAQLRAWWTGTHLTAGWDAVHDAEAELVHLEREESVRAALPRLITWLQDVMPSGEERTRYERELADFIDGRKRLDRTVVRQAYRETIDANNERHANLRTFRNLLALVTAALALLLVALAAWHAANPNFVSLCGSPMEGAAPAGSESSAASAVRRCLTGSEPRPADVAEIELVGAVGGMLSIAFGLGAVRTPPSRYNPRPQQVALKPVAGATTGLIGVMLVQSDILIAPAGSPSETLLLAYAAIFGFAQHLLTQFVDKRAGELLGEQDAAASSTGAGTSPA